MSSLDGEFEGPLMLPVWKRGVPWDDQVSVDKMERYTPIGRRMQLWAGAGIRIHEGPNGTVIEADPSDSSPGAPTVYKPFQIFALQHLVGGIWDGSYDVSLYPGTVNQLLPTNMFTKFNGGIASLYYVLLTCESDGYSVTSSTWSIESSQPTPHAATVDIPPSSFSVLLGLLGYDPDTGIVTVYQTVTTNLSAAPGEWTRTSRAGAGPFDLAYQVYYNWAIGFA